MSDTPRTDAHIMTYTAEDGLDEKFVDPDFARELELENLALKAALSEIEEREAACCPEDVPFDEMIASMGRKSAELKALADHWAGECENLAKWLRESRDENAELKNRVKIMAAACWHGIC